MSYGYYNFKGLKGIDYMPFKKSERKPKVRGKHEDILDLIYCLDPITGLPTGAVDQFLSEKTNEQVRQYIEQVIFKEIPRDEYPANLREEILNLDSEFIAKTCRNRFEPRDEYETRVKSYFDEIEHDKEVQRKVKDLRKLFGKDE